MRLGKSGCWGERRHNLDKEMEEEAEVARRENKSGDMCWGRVWMSRKVYWNKGEGQRERWSGITDKKRRRGGRRSDLVLLFCCVF